MISRSTVRGYPHVHSSLDLPAAHQEARTGPGALPHSVDAGLGTAVDLQPGGVPIAQLQRACGKDGGFPHFRGVKLASTVCWCRGRR